MVGDLDVGEVNDGGQPFTSRRAGDNRLYLRATRSWNRPGRQFVMDLGEIRTDRIGYSSRLAVAFGNGVKQIELKGSLTFGHVDTSALAVFGTSCASVNSCAPRESTHVE